MASPDITLDKISETIREFQGIKLKREISVVKDILGDQADTQMLHDDGVFFSEGDRFIVTACDAILPMICKKMPRFAGRSAVVATVNDLYAMGATPSVIMNSIGAKTNEDLAEILVGMKDAAEIFGIKIHGGHLMPIGSPNSITVTAVGTSKKPILSTTLKDSDCLLMVFDTKGVTPDNYPLAWNSTFGRDPKEVRRNYEMLHRISDQGLLTAGKDISNAGLIGTTAILLETSDKGAVIDIDKIIVPENISPINWYRSFFSFGFIFGVSKENEDVVIREFKNSGLSANTIGKVNNTHKIILKTGEQTETLFNWGKDSILRRPCLKN
ncbi:MAG: hypothetical protein HF978_13410 [Desulfobacteraceae bacterium]|nr:hypothetical protein [Desulfobacteraceae bacterium]MBC2756540.1 hypothetical protein [Desulfobacteraceae bacterium]